MTVYVVNYSSPDEIFVQGVFAQHGDAEMFIDKFVLEHISDSERDEHGRGEYQHEDGDQCIWIEEHEVR